MPLLRVKPWFNSASVKGTSKVDVYVPPPSLVPLVQYCPELHPHPWPTDVPPDSVKLLMFGVKFDVVRSSALSVAETVKEPTYTATPSNVM